MNASFVDVNHYLNFNKVKNFTELTAAIKPFKQLSGIGYFRIHDDGTCSNIGSTNPEILRYLFRANVHLLAHVPKDLICNRTWYLVPEKNNYEPNFRDYRDQFKIASVCNFIERGPGYIDAFGLFSNLENSAVSNFYLNFIEKLEATALMIKDRAKESIERESCFRVQVNANVLPNIRGLSFGKVTENNIIPSELRSLFINNKTIYFTKREIDCLRELPFGKTARQIGETLDLSTRTVEFYLDNIKGKIGCSKKSQILESLVTLRELR